MGIKFTIDPGHVKGYNVGIVPSYAEGTAMYNLAVYLKAALEKYEGFTAVITRNNVEDNPTLAQRGKMAIDNNSNVFISLHSDAFTDSSACGVSIFRSLRLPDSNTLSTSLGKAVAVFMNKYTGVTNFRGSITKAYPNTTNTDYYGVIRASVEQGSNVQYSFLLEHGFHTNPKECLFLNSTVNLKALATTEAKVFADYFKVSLKNGETTNDTTQQSPTKTDKIETYQVIAESISGYNTAFDASDRINPISVLKAGMYYVYRRYSNGAINITTDKTIVKPGSWINPEDNILITPDTYEVIADTIPIYTTSADAAKGTNQAGTYKKGTYYIYGKKTSTGMINITTDKRGKTPGGWINESDNHVTDPMDNIDTEGLTPIALAIDSMPIITFRQAVDFVKKNNPEPKITCSIEELVYWFTRAGFEERIRWDIAFAQSIIETGYFKYGGAVKPEQNNYAGIGATNGGATGAVFKTPYEGALAQIQHLKAYANEEDCSQEIVDPRFKYVTRAWAPFVEWLGMNENPKNKIYGKTIGWAVPGDSYGATIMRTLHKIKEL